MDVEIGLAIGVIFSLFAGAVIRTQLGRVELLGRTRKSMHPAAEGDGREIFSTVIIFLHFHQPTNQSINQGIY